MARSIEVTLELNSKQFDRSLKKSEQQVKGFEKSSVTSFGAIGTALAAIGTGAAIRGIVETGAAFQDLQNSLNVVFGSVDAGAAAFQRVQDFASSTQFSVETLTGAFVQLKGAGVEPTAELLQTFADTASVSTDQMGTFQAALDLVSRSTAGGLGLEDLNRLADRGIPVFRILQERLGLARLEISEFGKTADGANQIISALLAGLQEDFGGALSTQVGLINFELNQLGDAVDKFKVALFATFSEDAASGIQSLTSAINKLADNMDSLVSILKILGAGFIAVRLAALNISKIFITVFDKTKALFTGTGLLAKNFKTLTDAVRLLGTGIAGLGFRGLIAALVASTAAFAPYIAAAIAAGFAIFELAKFMGFFTDASDKLADAADHNAHVLEHQAEQERLAAEKAAELAAKTKAAADAAEAFQRGYDNASKSVEKFKQEIFDSNDPLSNYQEFLSDILAESNNMAVQQVFAAKAVNTLREFLDAGLISTRAFGIAIEKLNSIMGITPFQDFIDSLQGLTLTTEEYNEFQRQLNALIEKYPEMAEEAARAQDVLNEALMKDEAMNNFLNTLGQAQKALSEDLATAFLEGQSAGEAFQDFFKKMVTQILADILRLQIIQPILGSLFGLSFGAGGSVKGMDFAGSFFGGLFGRANGGPVMKNRPVIVGEQGPELFMPTAGGNVIPNSALGGGAVTYNINAVDARSFKELVAQDPEFIFNVTQVGARRQPR
tara:strand:- start:9574 stop:11745 length:2172 start_codon:yes stop_codon:yes gene_type:complete